MLAPLCGVPLWSQEVRLSHYSRHMHSIFGDYAGSFTKPAFHLLY
jgi:hypothetical protein